MGRRLDLMADVTAAEKLRRELERASGVRLPMRADPTEAFTVAAAGVADRLERIERALGPALRIPAEDAREARRRGA